MAFSFKKFEDINQRFEDRISITTSRGFGFPTRFYKNQNMDQYKYAVIYYDEEKKAVGIHFTNNEEEKSKIRLVKSSKGYGAGINATSFFKSYNIDTKKYAGKYKWEISEEPIGKLYVIVLSEKPSHSDSKKIDASQSLQSPSEPIIVEPVNQQTSTAPIASQSTQQSSQVQETPIVNGGVPERQNGAV